MAQKLGHRAYTDCQSALLSGVLTGFTHLYHITGIFNYFQSEGVNFFLGSSNTPDIDNQIIASYSLASFSNSSALSFMYFEIRRYALELDSSLKPLYLTLAG